MKINKPIIVILLSAILLTSCGADILASTPANSPLKIAYTDWPGDYIVLLAQELGYFDEYGVEVTPIHYASFSSTFPDMAIGKVDGLNSVPIDLLPIIQDNNIRIVMVTDCSNGADQIVASSDIQTIADLRGKRIGANIGTFGEFLVREMLTRNSIEISEITLVDVNPEQVPEFIPDIIDAGHTWEPHTSRAEALGQKIIFSSAEVPGLLPDVFALRADVVKNRPEDVRNFVAAWLQASAWWLENPEEGSQIIAEVIGANPEDISLEGIRIYTAADNKLAFAENPGTDTNSIYYVIQKNLEFSIETGYITIAPDLGIIIDPSFLP